jgi:hypothetical protein
MHPHAALLHSFYDAFQRRDYRAMAACYASGAEFHDPVFTHLSGWRVPAMWRMLCERATDFRLEVNDIRQTDVFDLYAWTRQALGLKGLLLGWTPPVQHAVRAQASRALEAFSEKHGLIPTTP